MNNLKQAQSRLSKFHQDRNLGCVWVTIISQNIAQCLANNRLHMTQSLLFLNVRLHFCGLVSSLQAAHFNPSRQPASCLCLSEDRARHSLPRHLSHLPIRKLFLP